MFQLLIFVIQYLPSFLLLAAILIVREFYADCYYSLCSPDSVSLMMPLIFFYIRAAGRGGCGAVSGGAGTCAHICMCVHAHDYVEANVH